MPILNLILGYILGPEIPASRPRPDPVFARFPTVPRAPSHSIFMTISAFYTLIFVTLRGVRITPLLPLGTYFFCSAFHSLWSNVEHMQLLALMDSALRSHGICDGCRDKAFACPACMRKLIAERLDRGGPWKCDHEEAARALS